MRQFHKTFLILLCYVHLQMHRHVNYCAKWNTSVVLQWRLDGVTPAAEKRSLCRMVYQTATANAELCSRCAQSF